MDSKPPKSATGTGGTSRDDRRKAALKANLARRKAQARMRGQGKGAADQPMPEQSDGIAPVPDKDERG